MDARRSRLGPRSIRRGRFKRRATIAQALAARWLADRADLRVEPGSRWLIDGVAGWLGLECIRVSAEAWLAVLARGVERIDDAFGALDAPLSGLANDGGADWVRQYAPHATLSWAEALAAAHALRIAEQVADRVRAGVTIRGAPSRRLHVPAQLEVRTPFVVFDAVPSFERSPKDNAWRGAAAP